MSFIGRTDAEAETPILWPPDVFLPVPHCGVYYRAVLQFEVREEDASSCVLLFQSSWPFKVLFNISSLLVGVFLFL